jgi:predicted RNase H-like HicB family nuclease
MIKMPHYSMIIRWDSRSDIFVVSVPELPGCMTHGKTYEEAVKQGKDAIESWIMAALANHEPLPPLQQFTDVAQIR